MIQRLYVHNFRCLENFVLPIADTSSSLLIGKNGSGKSTVGFILEVLQSIARGQNRVGDLIKPTDFAIGRTDVPIRIEIEVKIHDNLYQYTIAFELPQGFRELRVAEEELSVDGSPIYSREKAQVTLAKTYRNEAAKFLVDWHQTALPIIQEQSDSDPILIFKNWLSRMIILAPIPGQISGDSAGDTLMPNRDVKNFGEWFSGVLAYSPAAYSRIDKHLKEVMPDIRGIKNPVIGIDVRSLSVQFEKDRATISLPFKDLSDGEKCFFICAVVLAAIEAYGPLFCFWDEPDNYLALSEVGHFLLALRQSFQSGNQLIVTSHNPEAIRRFSRENTIILHRHSHLEPTLVRKLSELNIDGDLVDALIRNDVDL